MYFNIDMPVNVLSATHATHEKGIITNLLFRSEVLEFLPHMDGYRYFPLYEVKVESGDMFVVSKFRLMESCHDSNFN